MTRVEFHPEARAEFRAATRRYEAERRGLGRDFRAAVQSGWENVAQNPERWPHIEPGIRRFLVDRFPYSLIYALRGDEIVILAVMHQHRKPGYWEHRAR